MHLDENYMNHGSNSGVDDDFDFDLNVNENINADSNGKPHSHNNQIKLRLILHTIRVVGDEDWIDVIEKKKCVFCDHRLRKMKRGSQTVITTTSTVKQSQILHILDILNEQQKLKEIENAPSMFYHTSCLSELQYKHVKSRTPKKSTTATQSDWAARRSIHSTAFSKILKNINESLIEKGGVKALSDIYASYNAIFKEEELKSNSKLSERNFVNRIRKTEEICGKKGEIWGKMEKFGDKS